MSRSHITYFLILLFIFSFSPHYFNSDANSQLKGDILPTDPKIDGVPDNIWDPVPNIETEFDFLGLTVPFEIRLAYFKSSLYILADLFDTNSIDNSTAFRMLFDLDESSSLTQGDLLVEISIFSGSTNITVGKFQSTGSFNLTNMPNFARTKIQYDTDRWVAEIQLVTYNDQDTFVARESLVSVFSYQRVENGQIHIDSAFDNDMEVDLLSVGSWETMSPITFPPFDAIISVFHAGIEKITSGATLVKIVTYISFGTTGPIEDIRIVLRSPLPIQAFTGISSEIIANSLLQRYSITVTAREAPEGGIIRLTYFLNTVNRTSDHLVWEPLNISYYNTVNQYTTLLAGDKLALDFTGVSAQNPVSNGSSLLERYNITVTENDFSLLDTIFPTFYRNLVLDIIGVLLIVFGLTILRSWWITGKELDRFRKKGEQLIIKSVQMLGHENPELAKSFVRRAYLDLQDSLNKSRYKFQYRVSKPEDISFHWTEFLFNLEKRLKVYYQNHNLYDEALQMIFSNFDLFHGENE